MVTLRDRRTEDPNRIYVKQANIGRRIYESSPERQMASVQTTVKIGGYQPVFASIETSRIRDVKRPLRKSGDLGITIYNCLRSGLPLGKGVF